MKQTDQTLFEQMRITEFDVDNRKALLFFTQAEAKALLSFRPALEKTIDSLVAEFYQSQTSVAEIALLIGDADTLNRLSNAQRKYILDLFSGLYDLEYVNHRLRIGLVHKRIGVEPKLYLSAIHTLIHLLHDKIRIVIQNEVERDAVMLALNKLILFDVTLVFETYIRSLVSEIETAKEKSEAYARAMEEKVKQRTQQLEEMSCIDPLTELLNVRHLEERVTQALRSSQRRGEPVSMVYIDVNDFKKINDTQGHLFGDDNLRTVGKAIKSVSRIDDGCFRHGGGEFCVVMSNCLEEEAQERYVTRLNEKLKEGTNNISLSTGIAQAGPIEYVDARTLIRQADEKMYAAKNAFKSKGQLASTLGAQFE
jgi:diguanylate cyclase (GGDEF)-like protein